MQSLFDLRHAKHLYLTSNHLIKTPFGFNESVKIYYGPSIRFNYILTFMIYRLIKRNKNIKFRQSLMNTDKCVSYTKASNKQGYI